MIVEEMSCFAIVLRCFEREIGIFMTKYCKAVINYLGCEVEYFRNERDGDNILDRYNKLAADGRVSGFCPLIIVADRDMSEAIDYNLNKFKSGRSAEGYADFRKRMTEQSAAVDVAAFFEDTYRSFLGEYSEEDLMGEYAAGEKEDYLYLHMDGNRPCKEILIAKIPVLNPWELAAYVPMGGFDECPAPDVQTAVFKYWYERYGAVPCIVSGSAWEIKLRLPTKTRENAEILAKEHFAFCPSLVLDVKKKKYAKIKVLAGELVDSTAWGFQWFF